ncbi:hypothetical protein, partial [Escherichia coli]|uniref:hypothetical protein n=1 Tax=Escherichia coli TaxID=562 RepID=UPI001BD1EEFA
FHQYELARMPLAPKAVSVHLLKPDGDLPLGGVGEPGVPPIAPALCNAIFVYAEVVVEEEFSVPSSFPGRGLSADNAGGLVRPAQRRRQADARADNG